MPTGGLPRSHTAMRLLPLVALATLAGCVSTAPAPSTGATPTRTTTSVTTGGGANLDIAMYADNAASTTTVQAPIERVWAVLPAVYEQLQIPVGTVDPTARAIGNQRLQAKSGRIAGERASSFLTCGSTAFGGPVADTYQVNASLLTSLQPGQAGSTQVQTMLEASATQRGVSGAPVRCATTGQLEQRIATLIQQQLAAR